MNDASHCTGGYLLSPASPCSHGLGGAVVEQIDRASPVKMHHDGAIGVALAFRPVVVADHTGGWLRSGLVVADPAQHGLAAARQTLPRELAGTCRPALRQAGITLGLARPGGGVGRRTCHGRHPLGEGPPTTGGGAVPLSREGSLNVPSAHQPGRKDAPWKL